MRHSNWTNAFWQHIYIKLKISWVKQMDDILTKVKPFTSFYNNAYFRNGNDISYGNQQWQYMSKTTSRMLPNFVRPYQVNLNVDFVSTVFSGPAICVVLHLLCYTNFSIFWLWKSINIKYDILRSWTTQYLEELYYKGDQYHKIGGSLCNIP